MAQLEGGCAPGLIAYSTLTKEYCVCGELDEAMKLFSTMRESGIRPDAIVFDSLFDGGANERTPSAVRADAAGVQPSALPLMDAAVAASSFSSAVC